MIPVLKRGNMIEKKWTALEQSRVSVQTSLKSLTFLSIQHILFSLALILIINLDLSD